ncbi:MAG TPA: response regulator transcription factor [Cyclobacteriaceae bacterium]|nr:response regulator transcription factor [Cyclobacteriaceae bacterium]
MDHIRIVLAEDHLIVRKGIKNLLEDETGLEVVGEASNGIEAIEAVENMQPDLLIADIRMPEMSGLEATQVLATKEKAPHVLILSMHDDEDYILQSVEAGASGYLLKDTSKEELLKAIRIINQGGKYFSGDVSNALVNRYLSGRDKRTRGADSVVANSYNITKRERQILAMIADGVGNKEIAEQLGKSVRTVETHRFNIMKKLRVNNIVELLKKMEEEPALKQFIQNR